ncbi:MAG: YbhB/YbcL family Raf kinase inhibitor-like protein [Candidatus Nanoarchaeia archaeon]|nr:YbhB/YbcL family Raf kinase inhibitor-like protein [Candidatus Nanoarchaeia archaeon]
MEIRSVFGNNERIPLKYTCDGKNVNPPLEFSDIPKNAKSLVLIVDDPDSPSGIFTHWMLWNIPANTVKINENSVPKGTREGKNDFGNVGYGGPCPHSGTHRYQFKLFALDINQDLASGFSKKDAENRIKGHIIERAVLTGIYSR